MFTAIWAGFALGLVATLWLRANGAWLAVAICVTMLLIAVAGLALIDWSPVWR